MASVYLIMCMFTQCVTKILKKFKYRLTYSFGTLKAKPFKMEHSKVKMFYL